MKEFSLKIILYTYMKSHDSVLDTAFLPDGLFIRPKALFITIFDHKEVFLVSGLSIDPTIYHERPADHHRLPVETACYDLLEKLSVAFDRVDHVATPSMEDCIAIGELLHAEICKNLFLCNRQKTKFYLLLMPGNKEFRTKDLSAQINSARLSFADAQTMEKMLGTTPGSASVLGLMQDKEGEVTLLIDRDVVQQPYFACHPCVNTGSIRFSTEDLLKKVLPALKHEPVFVTL